LTILPYDNIFACQFGLIEHFEQKRKDRFTFIVSCPPDVFPVKMTNDSSVSQDDDDQGNDVKENHPQKEVHKLLKI
jgi:hypothetical protein